MLTNPKDHITSTQAAVLVTSFILGVGILTLPRTVTEKVGTADGWIAVLLGGLVAMLLGVLLVKLSQLFPGKTLYQYSQEIVGQWMGLLINLYAVGYFTLLAAFEIRAMGEVTNFFLLPATPIEVTMGLLLFASAYLVVGGINPIARLCEVILPITILLFFLVLFMGFKNFELDNLRPVLERGWMPVIKGLETTTLSYLGLETMLFLPAFMSEPRQALKAVLAGIGIPVIFYVMTVIVVIGALTIDDVVTLTFPTIELVRSFELEGVLFERYESFLLAVWILQIYTTLSLCHYLAGLGLAQLFQKGKFQSFIIGLLPVIYVLAWKLKTINDVFALGELLGYMGMVMVIAVPIILCFIAKVRGMLLGNKQ
ncbi:GerAB/ArcD/ProY family transporter [Laceyella putida]|uniref:GerAB/ArcD/ProY family transporter n=1 Tax=Laceyella putida TaxID=110101 RepID=A0ABW2RQR5_9BACL